MQPPPAPPKPPPPVAAPPAPVAAPVAEPLPDRPGLRMGDYRKEIAQAIVHANADDVFNGKLPPLLRSVVVLQIAIDGRGVLADVTLFRSNGFTELDRRAIAAVHRAAPYPIPGRSLLAGQGTIVFTESFLFRNDGRFQVRTIAEEQSTDVTPHPPVRHPPSRPCCGPKEKP